MSAKTATASSAGSLSSAGAGGRPRISVLMCAYNAAAWVEEAVRSVLRQSLSDFEILLFDDGSTDATPLILQRLAAADGRIRLQLRPHGNYCDNLNEALAMARGQYIARADADDLNEPERFAQQVALLDARLDVVVVGSRVTEIDPFGVPLNITGEDDQPEQHNQIERLLLAGNGWALCHPAIMARTEAMRQVGGYRPQFLFAEDVDLFLRLAEVGRLANIPRPLVQYRRHDKSVGLTHTQLQRRRLRQILEEAHARRGLPMPLEPEFFRITPLPRSNRLERWTWNALRAGRPDVARRHAFRRLRLSPFSPRVWKLCLCALRGR